MRVTLIIATHTLLNQKKTQPKAQQHVLVSMMAVQLTVVWVHEVIVVRSFTLCFLARSSEPFNLSFGFPRWAPRVALGIS
jgi:hypothetical protein